jgi:hypothetical protein
MLASAATSVVMQCEAIYRAAGLQRCTGHTSVLRTDDAQRPIALGGVARLCGADRIATRAPRCAAHRGIASCRAGNA